MKKIAITFGPEQDHPDIAERIQEGYVVIEAPTREIARGIADAIFGARLWSFDYDLDDVDWESDNARKGYYPAGELLRIAWLGFNQQKAIAIAIDDTYEAADGGSNDEEIQALQDARDLLAAIIGYIPEDERDWSVPESHELEVGPDLPTHLREERTREPFTGQSGEW